MVCGLDRLDRKILFMMASSLKLCTYNIEGFNDTKVSYLQQVINQNDIILLQEHWLFDCQSHLLNECLDNVNSHCISGMNADYALSRGRRFGGCAILWNISLKCSVEPIVCSNNRLCVVKVIFDSYSIIVCNMYMPCDNTGDINTYNEVWADAINICNAHDAQYVIFAGDLNTDLTRHNSAHTTGLIDLCRSENFTCVKTHPQCQIDYSYESKINGQKSCLDHFIISDNLHDSVQSCYVAHDYDNMSDHSVVYLNLLLNFDVSHILVDTVIENVSKPMWWKASHGNIVNYKTHLDQLLNDIDLPVHVISCTDVMCDRHKDHIQLYHDNIVVTN